MLTFQDQIHNQELKIEQQKTEAALQKANMLESLMIASMQEPDMDSAAYRDKTTYPKDKQETEGQKLQRKGGYIDTGELDSDGKPLMIQGMPPEINPEEHKRLQKQKKIRGIAEEGATEGERQAGRGKLKDQTQLPNFLKTVLDSRPNPLDVLKILQFLPALTGGGLGQMAGGQELRNHLKPYTRGKNPWDTGGGSLQHLSPEERLKLTIGGIERFKV